jgi:2'-5' RNA ligase
VLLLAFHALPFPILNLKLTYPELIRGTLAMPEAKDARVFFALWPDSLQRDSLNRQNLAIEIDGSAHRVPDYNLHLTLHFVGNVSFDQLERMQESALEVQAESFELTIDCQGYFEKPRVLWLGCSTVPDGLNDLHQRLGAALGKSGFQPEARPFNPHITIARKLKAPDLIPIDPIVWPVDRFALIQSTSKGNGVVYSLLRSYPLAYPLQ